MKFYTQEELAEIRKHRQAAANAAKIVVRRSGITTDERIGPILIEERSDKWTDPQ